MVFIGVPVERLMYDVSIGHRHFAPSFPRGHCFSSLSRVHIEHLDQVELGIDKLDNIRSDRHIVNDYHPGRHNLKQYHHVGVAKLDDNALHVGRGVRRSNRVVDTTVDPSRS